MTAIELKDFEVPSVFILPDAIEKRDNLIQQCKGITVVDDSFVNECAVEILRDVARMKADVEKTRKQLKQPVLDLGRAIDGAAKDFLTSLGDAERGVKKLVDSYAAEQRRIQFEAERKRREEEERIAKEKAEAARKLEEAKTAEEQQAAKAVVEEKVKEQADLKLSPVKTEEKSEGMSVRVSKDFEIQDIEALWKARPDLVHMMPKRSAILEAIKTVDSIPGIKIFEKTSTSIRR